MTQTLFHPEKNPIYISFAERLNAKIIGIDKFIESYPPLKDDPPLCKALKETRNLLIEAISYMEDFYSETEKYFSQITVNNALKEVCRHQREELEQYKNLKKIMLSDQKEEIIRTVVEGLEKLLERENS